MSCMLILSLARFDQWAPDACAALYADLQLSYGDHPLGVVRIDLEYERAPRPVANFVGLATGQYPWIHPVTGLLMTNTPYFEGVIFHRLVHDFVIQGGDPSGTGRGGPGYIFPDHYHPDLRHIPYAVSMAHSGRFTNGSQFFIMLTTAPSLDDLHSVFGTISDADSRAIIDNFKNASLFPTDTDERPLTNIVIHSVTVGGSALDDFDLFDPDLWLPSVKPVEAAIGYNDDQAVALSWPKDLTHQYHLALTSSILNWFPASNFYFSMSTNETASDRKSVV